jgi:hypothetical protein
MGSSGPGGVGSVGLVGGPVGCVGWVVGNVGALVTHKSAISSAGSQKPSFGFKNCPAKFQFYFNQTSLDHLNFFYKICGILLNIFMLYCSF